MTSSWPWLVMMAWLLAVEGWLIATHRQTLSQRARAAGRRWPWLPWVVVAGTVLLYGHFWAGWLW